MLGRSERARGAVSRSRRVSVFLPVLVLVVLMLPPCGAGHAGEYVVAQRTADEAVSWDGFVRESSKAAGAPGVVYAVVGPEGIEHVAAFGDDGDGRAVTARTPFLWGSVSKPVAATLVMVLARDGVLRLDEPVTTYLPAFELADRAVSGRVTVKDLLTHTSGIPEALNLTDQFDAGRRPADVLPSLVELEPVAAPGDRYVYSSVNYLVLAAVVEQVTGRRFADVLTDRVLAPAGMNGAIATREQATERLPPGHRLVLGRATGFRTPYDPAGAAYGYLGGSVTDLAAFAQANLGEADMVLGLEDRQSMYAPRISTDPGGGYGLGWRTSRLKGTDVTMVWHTGAVTGYVASLILLPDLDRAVVVLENAYSPFQDGALLATGFGLARLVAGQQPEAYPSTPGANIGYWALLGVLLTTSGVLLALCAVSVRTLVRRRTATTGKAWPHALRVAGTVAWLLMPAAICYVFAVVLPASYGLALNQVVLWTPDVAWLEQAGIVLSAVLVALRVAVFMRARRLPDQTG